MAAGWLAGGLAGWSCQCLGLFCLCLGLVCLWVTFSGGFGRALHIIYTAQHVWPGDVNRVATQQTSKGSLCPPPLGRLASVWHALWRCDRQKSQSKHKHIDLNLSTVQCCDLVGLQRPSCILLCPQLQRWRRCTWRNQLAKCDRQQFCRCVHACGATRLCVAGKNKCCSTALSRTSSWGVGNQDATNRQSDSRHTREAPCSSAHAMHNTHVLRTHALSPDSVTVVSGIRSQPTSCSMPLAG